MIRNLMFPKYDENGYSHIYMPPLYEKALFIDIDGNICPTKSNMYNRWYHDLKRLKEYLAKHYNDPIYLNISDADIGGAFYEWDPVAVANVRKISDTTAAGIVIHSDLTIWNDLDNFKAMFKLYGMDEYIVGSCNKKLDKMERSNYYLETHPNIKEYAVIDDDKELSVFGNHFIQTKDKISEEDVKKAIKILGVY